MPQKECEDLVLQAVTQVNTYYGVKQLNSLMQRSYGSYIINRSAGNQKRRQLWRMLQDGNYHQGESVKNIEKKQD